MLEPMLMSIPAPIHDNPLAALKIGWNKMAQGKI